MSTKIHLMNWFKILRNTFVQNIYHYNYTILFLSGRSVRDVVAYLLVHWTPGWEVQVWGLAESMCCVLGQSTLPSRCLSPTPPHPPTPPPPLQMSTGELSRSLMKCWGGNLAMDWHPIQKGVVILLVAAT